ncbi:MAG: LysR family transcriptional regulator [Pseudomonadota bacterium]
MSKPLDRLALLETFVRIADRGSISGAARDLGMAQGSASRQLKDLEERLGIQLIRRTTHALTLTDAGLEVLRDARELIARWETMVERHRHDADIVRGPLGVVAPVALGQSHLADVALSFQTAHPQVVLNWRLQDEAIRFAEVGCDCWIKVGPIPDDTLIVRRLGRIERLVVGTPRIAADLSERTPDDLESVPFVGLTPFEGGRITLTSNDGTQRLIRPPVRLATNNILSMKRAVLQGIGAAIMPRWFVAAELERGQVEDLLPDWRADTLDINVGYLPVRHQPRRLSLFLEALEAATTAIPGFTV